MCIRDRSDVQSIFGNVGDITASGPGYGTTFSADIIPKVSSELGIGSISGITRAAGFIATFTSPSLTFPGIVTTGNLVQWSRPGYSVPIMAKVNVLNTDPNSYTPRVILFVKILSLIETR